MHAQDDSPVVPQTRIRLTIINYIPNISLFFRVLLARLLGVCGITPAILLKPHLQVLWPSLDHAITFTIYGHNST